ncbi:MAG: hypothetical protein WED10_03955 [Brumimicrobium sp.]
MRLIFSVLICLFFSFVSFSQNSNEKRMKELPSLIDKAVENKDYDEASKLQKELDIREDLKKAIEEEDYKEATKLREDLYDLESGEYKSDDNEDIDSFDDPEQLKKNSVFYFDYTFGGMNIYSYDRTEYVNVYDEQGYMIGTEEVTQNYKDFVYSMNFKLGHKFYIGSGSSNLRLGLDLNYMSLNIGIPSLNNNIDPQYSSILPNLSFTLPNPGFVATYHMRDDMGLDFQFNAGVMFLLSNYNEVPIPMPGFHLNPQLKFWYKKIAIGLEFVYFDVDVDSFENSREMKVNHLGLSFGLRL